MTFNASVLTLYPDAFPGPLGVSLLETARKNGLWALETVDIRSFSRHKHASVDDTPAGGGPGMVLRPDVSAAAIDSLPREGRPLIYLTPRGKPLTQAMVREWSAGPGVIVFCGRFEGLDQRVIEARGMDEVSVGDAVLAGGEAPAMVLIEACVRLIPGVLGKIESTEDESFEGDLLEYPHYTRPREWEEREIPDVLLSGDHGRIARWRKEQAEDITRLRRPDLWKRYQRRQGEEP
ncbi:tRNA (guanosine(37)-N1)-methyltransferase TrmD [Oceanicaulis alexandrii]|jgi:tRNA (guanine37-N1)-methyltransferase|uniref:tRNA (guanosine(37)-N1)-methyltransferase TrmD n=1 Tax=Oceanicaulis alexandrii TaxID=153233 RepID=UPI0003B5CD0E|nr:tRNA (guanosine(37)-N1)-methyltransferase TrmD [Oceanicaulis alexandrii]MBL4539435.1 tRNA (guanosine(37)-N1)-methyltransferase TrmD [Oceanicaulis sp.]VXC86488.1 tRNA (guanine-1-)-methyltransferase [Oceanicaulis sp. 350]|tara:strand:- start:1734 stop:2438 length:705 start_codon:yes stop_codon:yes gene_type:complete